MDFLHVVVLALAGTLAHVPHAQAHLASVRSEIEVEPHSFVAMSIAKEALNSSLRQNPVLIRKHAATVSIAPDLMEVFEHNQRTRNSIKSWITAHDLENSVFNYGLGPPVESLAKDTGPDPIQHDFVSQLGARIEANGEMVRFLEIGVSVLKSVHTQSNFFRNAVITSFDIEDPNPTIEALWKDKTVVDEWDVDETRAQHNRRNDYINKYQGPNNNTLYYIAGDAYSGVTYDHFFKTIVSKTGPMNLVLSDAFHSGDSVTSEVDSLLSHGIIVPGKSFTIVWDDCGDSEGIYPAMPKIFRRLRLEFEGQATCSGRFRIPGWVGKNEFWHGTCVFSTMDLSGPHLQASHTWIATDNDVTCQSGQIGWIDRILLLLDGLGRFGFWFLMSILCLLGLALAQRTWLKSKK